MKDDLRLVHERIAELEAAIAGRMKPKDRQRRIRIGLVLAFAVLLGFFLPLHRPRIGRWAAAGPETLQPKELSLADGRPPILVKGARANYAIVRAWSSNRHDAPLHVVAFDRRDWSRAWVSRGVETTDDDRGDLLLYEPYVDLVVANRRISIAIDGGRSGAVATNPLPSAPKNDIFIPPPTWALASLARDGTSAGQAIIGGGRLFWFFGDGTGARHLQAVGMGDHKLAYDVAIPGLGYGTKLNGMIADEAEVIITANDSLIVLDAATGLFKKRIDGF